MKKRLASILLALVMLLSLLPTAALAGDVTSLTGSGTLESPYIISSLDELKFFRDQINAGNVTYYGTAYQGKYFALTTNIDLNNENWTPIGTSSHSFTGHFDGGNHTISNLYVNTTENFAGLFGYTGDQVKVSIKNLTIDNANVSGKLFAGAVVGENKQYITLDNVHVKGVIKAQVTSTNATSDAGGIIGKTIGGSNVTGCSTIADADSGSFVKTARPGSASAGGIMGFMAGDCSADCCFTNCVVKNVDITSYNRVGGIVGTIQKSDGQKCKKYVTNCSVENVHVTVTGPNDTTNYGNRHDAQGGLIVGCSAGTSMRYLNEYSNNTYSGDCSVSATNANAGTDVIPTLLYGLWSLGATRAADIGQTLGVPATGDCVITYASDEETGEVLFDGTYYKTFLSAYHSEGAGKTGSSADKPFKLMTDVGYSLVIGDAIYVDNDGNHIFYPRTDKEGYRVKTTAIDGNVTLYELETDPNVTFVASLTVGDTVKSYTTLEKAFAAAPTNGTACTITVLDNCTVGAKIITNAGNNITLELNGKTVEMTAISGAMIYSAGPLTVQDNTDTNADGTGTGKLWVHPATGNAMVLATYGDSSVININSGTVLAESSNGTSQTVYTSKAGKVNANGGLIEAKVASGQLGYALRINDIDAAKEGTEFVLNGATLKGNSNESYLIYNQSYFRGARMSLVKGTIISTGTDASKYNEVRTTGNDVSYDIEDIVAVGSYRIKVNATTYKVVDYVGKIEGTTYKTLEAAKTAYSDGIEGGEFYADPTDYVNGDYKAVKRGGTNIWDVVPKTYVAQIGTTKYETLAEAIAAVTDSAATTITMLADTKENVTIPANTNITIDLNGKTIDGDATGSVITVAKNGELTVKDSSATNDDGTNGTGKITNGKSTSGGGITNEGKLTLLSGHITKNENTTTGGTYGGGGVYNGSSATFVMNGGSISENVATKEGGGIQVSGGSGFTMTKGIIEKNTCTGATGGGGIYAGGGATIKISGGTIQENTAPGSGAKGGGICSYGANIEISGDTIIQNNKAYSQGGGIGTASDTEATLKITGGTIINNESTGNYGGDIGVTGKTVATISGGIIGGANSKCYGSYGTAIFRHSADKGGITITGTVEVNGNVAVDYPSTATAHAEISGGKFTKEILNDDGGITGFISGGIFTEAAKAATNTALIEAGKSFISNTDDATKEAYPWTVGVPPVAQITKNGVTTQFSTLQSAVSAAVDGDTIILLDNIALAEPARLDKKGTYIIDGNGHTITAAAGASFGADGCLCFGPGGQWTADQVSTKIFTIKNTTFSGFTTGVNDVIRAEGCTLTIDKCTFSGNTVNAAARSKSVVLLTGVDAKIINSTFTDNTAGLCIDFNTQGGSANPNNGSNIKVDNCYFHDNTLSGNGVMYLYGPKGSVTNNTFESNKITADGAAVIYLSGKANRIANNLFKSNTVTAGGSGKLGVIAFGSSTAGTALEENAFVGNTLNKNSQAFTSGTAYVGAENISLERNYWGDGAAPEKGDTKDIYEGKTVTVKEFATAYALKSNSWGVNVTIAQNIAKNGTTVYTTYDSAKTAATGNKFGAGWYFNVDPSANLAENCIVVASDNADWLYMVMAKTVETDVKTDVEPGEEEATAPEENVTAQTAAQVVNDVDKTLGGVKDLQPDAASKLNDAEVINNTLESEAKKALTDDVHVDYDSETDTMMLVIEPYFDVAVKDGETDTTEPSKITSITYEIDAKYNILATTAATTEQIVKEGAGQNTVVVETGKDLEVTKAITLSIPLPAAFDADDGETVIVKHTHDGATYLYDGIIVVEGEQKFVTFTNPDGFSEFEIMKSALLTGAKIERTAGTQFYATLAEAVADVQNGETIVLLSDATAGTIPVSREVTFTIDNGGYTNGATIAAGDGYTLSRSENTYTVTEYVAPTHPTGGGGGSSSYAVTVNSAKNGSISVDKKTASSGSTVTITVTPAEGYQLGTLSVRDAKGNAVTLTKGNDTTYTFKMPAAAVTVTATFVKAASDGVCPKDATCPIEPFTDTKNDEWWHDGIHYCVENGMMNGFPGSVFKPNDPLSRAQIVTMLWRLEGSPVVNYAMSFADVPAYEWFVEPVRWAQSTGVVTGYDAESFGPNDNVTREQLAAILYRYAAYKGIDVSARADLAKFTDAAATSDWAVENMKWANAVGMVNGRTETTIVPTGTATRAEAAVMFQRFCEKVVK